MKNLLLLSSGKFINKQNLNWFDKPLNEMKMAYIITASKKVDDLKYLDTERDKFAEFGFDFEEMDIEGKKEDEIRNVLGDKELIYVTGGNTFHLLECARESGFDNIVKEQVSKGIVYIGVSAGSYIVCPTIEMATWGDNKRDRCGVTNFSAINLVPFLVVVHYNPEYREVLKKEISKSKYLVKILTDDQAVLVKDGKIGVLGGDEIKLL